MEDSANSFKVNATIMNNLDVQFSLIPLTNIKFPIKFDQSNFLI